MAKIALIEKQPSKIKYEQYFDFDLINISCVQILVLRGF